MRYFKRKHLLGLKDLKKEEIEEILQTAKEFKEILKRPIKKTPALRGKTVANLFFEPSTRTRISFELAAKFLSADVVNFSAQSSSLKKGESILDTLFNIEALGADIVVIRDSNSGTPHFLSKYSKATIINAGDGINEHPTQALLDMYTIKERKGTLEGLNVLIIGDILHSRVARSNIFGLKKFGCKITLCGPPTLLPESFKELDVQISYNLDEVLKDKDVIIMLRMQFERQKAVFVPSLREYRQLYSLNKYRYKLIKKDTLILHPGPVNWDTEIHSELKERLHSLILEQVKNGLAVRMALFYLLKENESSN